MVKYTDRTTTTRINYQHNFTRTRSQEQNLDRTILPKHYRANTITLTNSVAFTRSPGRSSQNIINKAFYLNKINRTQLLEHAHQNTLNHQMLLHEHSHRTLLPEYRHRNTRTPDQADNHQNTYKKSITRTQSTEHVHQNCITRIEYIRTLCNTRRQSTEHYQPNMITNKQSTKH